MAFSKCTGLTSVTLGSGLETIGECAFSGCSGLNEIYCLAVVPPVCGESCFDGVDMGNCNLNILDEAEQAYKEAEGWKEFFYEYFTVGGIKYAIISSTDKTVEVTYGEDKYTGDIIIPSTVENAGTTYRVVSIGEKTFSGCTGLTSIDIPDGVTTIGVSAFSGCTGLTSIDIPDGVTTIGTSAFSGCTGLTSINIPDGVTTIGDYAFYYCGGLTSVTLGSGVETIGECAFYDCRGLESVTLGSGLETIGAFAFENCSNLTSITIPDGVTLIGDYAFYGCSGLTSIDIPDGVTKIGGYAFFICENITSVTFGNGLKTIGDYAFYSCFGLAAIYCAASVPPVCGSGCFDNVNKTACTLYVPEGTVDDYKAADEWKDFYNIVETDLSGIEDIAADAAADVKVYAAAGRIVVENAAAGTPIAVYSVDGVLIYGGVVSDAFTEIPAPAGKLYIVKCGNAVFKTVM